MEHGMKRKTHPPLFLIGQEDLSVNKKQATGEESSAKQCMEVIQES